jgi:hypothetical protein
MATTAAWGQVHHRLLRLGDGHEPKQGVGHLLLQRAAVGVEVVVV